MGVCLVNTLSCGRHEQRLAMIVRVWGPAPRISGGVQRVARKDGSWLSRATPFGARPPFRGDFPPAGDVTT